MELGRGWVCPKPKPSPDAGGSHSETVRRLLTSDESNPHFSMVADLLRPTGLGLFVGKVAVPAESAPADPERVRAWLAHLGAPLYGSTAVKASDVPLPERVLAEALPLSHREASLARAPAGRGISISPAGNRLDFSLLRRLAGERGRGRALGFFLELTGDLSGRSIYLSRAKRDRSHARRDGASARLSSSSCEARPNVGLRN